MSLNTIIPNTQAIDKFLGELNFSLYYSKAVLYHIRSFLRAALTKGFSGKIIDVAFVSAKHRTTIEHFLSHGMWDETRMDSKIKDFSQYIRKTDKIMDLNLLIMSIKEKSAVWKQCDLDRSYGGRF